MTRLRFTPGAVVAALLGAIGLFFLAGYLIVGPEFFR